MSILESIVLGIVQGLCEFLPVSSSGHLELAQRVLGIQTPGLLLDTVLHAGTLLAVCVYFRKDIWALIRNPLGKDVRLLAVATVPAVVVTLLLGDLIDQLFSGALLGVAFLLTTGVLALAATFHGTRAELTYKDAGVMGLFQAAALLPGLSRSGSTISGGAIAGVARESAARFSFLMSIPAILGALVFQCMDLLDGAPQGNLEALPLTVGVAAAAVSGLFAIRFMMRIIRKAKLQWFGAYTLALGILVLIDQFVTHIYF